MGQGASDSLVVRMIKSDSIIITSHEDLQIYGKPGEEIIRRTILVKGLPNDSIIKEKLVLNRSAKDSLINLIKSQKTDPIFSPFSCFIPHHTIFIFSRGVCSYIDLCFACKGYSISKDIYYDDQLFASDDIWLALKIYFKSRNFSYKVEGK